MVAIHHFQYNIWLKNFPTTPKKLGIFRKSGSLLHFDCYPRKHGPLALSFYILKRFVKSLQKLLKAACTKQKKINDPPTKERDEDGPVLFFAARY